MSIIDTDRAFRPHLPRPAPAMATNGDEARRAAAEARQAHPAGCRCEGCEDDRWEARWVEAQAGLRCRTCLVPVTTGVHLRWCPHGGAA